MRPSHLDEAFNKVLARQTTGLVGTPLQTLCSSHLEGSVVTTAETFWGDQMAVELPEIASCEIYAYGLIEPDVTRLFLDVVSTGMVVYDVGAHFGYYSLLGTYLGARVHAFEPATSTLALLKKNLAERATVVERGMWSSETTLSLKDYGPALSSVNTFFHLRKESFGSPLTTTATPVTTIDRYVQASGEMPDLVKIDAEGAEQEVLRGARNTMRDHKPIIVVEIGGPAVSESGESLIELAESMDYEAYDMSPKGTQPHAPNRTHSYGNILLKPNGL